MNAVQPAVYILLAFALLAANAPFVFERRLFILKTTGTRKSFWWRVLELTLLYFVVGAIALGIESRQGQIYPQTWEFYVITYCLFLVFAYPGFVFCYLWRRK